LSTNELGRGLGPLGLMSSRVIEKFAHPLWYNFARAKRRRRAAPTGSGVFGGRKPAMRERPVSPKTPDPLAPTALEFRTRSVGPAMVIIGNLAKRKAGNVAGELPCALAGRSAGHSSLTLPVGWSITCTKCLPVHRDAHVGMNTTWLMPAPRFAPFGNLNRRSKWRIAGNWPTQVTAKRTSALTRRKWLERQELDAKTGRFLAKTVVTRRVVRERTMSQRDGQTGSSPYDRL